MSPVDGNESPTWTGQSLNFLEPESPEKMNLAIVFSSD